MNNREYGRWLFFCFAGTIVVFSGCVSHLPRATPICPGEETVAEAVSALKSRFTNAVPLKADGQCLSQFYVDGKKYNENFPVVLWVNPPAQIRLQGDIFLNPRGIDLGSNENEFWLSMKPKEVSTYSWGRWAEQKSMGKLVINPKTLLEALGIAEAGRGGNWSLLKKGPFDVLTKWDSENKIVKKMYVDTCDYRVSRIEYFGANEKAVVITELDKYEQVTRNFFVPAIIKITTYTQGKVEDSVKISLRTIEQKDFTAEKQNVFFVRPEPVGFKSIYKIINGSMIKL